MSIVAVCSQCHARLSAPEAALGKRVKCVKCGQPFVVAAQADAGQSVASQRIGSAVAQPTAETPPAPSRPVAPKKPTAPVRSAQAPCPAKLAEAELAAAFLGPVPRSRASFAYLLGLALAAGVMVALVAVYFVLIAVFGWVVYYHFSHHAGMLSVSGGGRVKALAFIAYLAPGFIGPVVIFFMLKPLLARPAKQERSRSLTRKGEPLLFAFVDQVCAAVRAPTPKRIDVDCDVNASAGFRRGMLSFLGRDLVLTIGLPLMAGLSLREFGGVLAHEFGHFSQGAGMRMSYLVRSLSMWFMRVVYQRDQWDVWLESSSEDLDLRLGWVVLLAQAAVGASRGVLWVLMRIGMLVSGVLMRQMEFDADRYETKFAGAKTFESTSRKLQQLHLASQLANAQLNEQLADRRLVDDLPSLIALNARMMPEATVAKLDAEAIAARTGWYDTHPCHRDRVAAAQQLGGDGVFHLESPARDLLTDFGAQTKATTWDLYMGVFGPQIPRDSLVSAPEFARACKSGWK